MTTNIYNAYIRNGEFFFGVIGQTVSDASIEPDELAERIWDLTNWTCWFQHNEKGPIKSKGITKDGVVYYPNGNDRGFTNDDIMFVIDGKWWVAESCGWKNFGTFSDAAAYLIKNANWICDKLDELK